MLLFSQFTSMLGRGTVDENILALQARKRGLANQLLAGRGDEAGGHLITAEDLDVLFEPLAADRRRAPASDGTTECQRQAMHGTGNSAPQRGRATLPAHRRRVDRAGQRASRRGRDVSPWQLRLNPLATAAPPRRAAAPPARAVPA